MKTGARSGTVGMTAVGLECSHCLENFVSTHSGTW